LKFFTERGLGFKIENELSSLELGEYTIAHARGLRKSPLYWHMFWFLS